ncbi:MAG TPA: YbaY family lipoprotein [Alphaproteobacteria bacterium]|nr:YbaY family lipoprotein [Alphaproteobacteria bacterium]
MGWIRPFILLAAVVGIALQPALAGDAVSGKALYRERITVPPEAVFTAMLQDISLADAPAVEIGRVVMDPAGQPPYEFSIIYDAGRIDQRHTYAVRTTITVGERLMFTSDAVHPVLTRGSPDHVEILMKMTSGQELGDRMQQSGIRAARFQGMFTFTGDVARFRECRTGRMYPVAMEASFPVVERAYRKNVIELGQPLLMKLEGVLAMRPKEDDEGQEQMLVVLALNDTMPGKTCDDLISPADLLDTRWVAERLGGLNVEPTREHRLPYLVLSSQDNRYRASAGCNDLGGQYLLDAQKLRFMPGLSSTMACPPTVREWEIAFKHVLAQTASYRIDGMILILIDPEAEEIARFRAEHL